MHLMNMYEVVDAPQVQPADWRSGTVSEVSSQPATSETISEGAHRSKSASQLTVCAVVRSLSVPDGRQVWTVI